jgi:hypothetical protein
MRNFNFAVVLFLTCVLLPASAQKADASSANKHLNGDGSLELIQKALLAHGRAVRDLRLSGTAISHYGKEESGTAILEMDAAGHSRVTLDIGAQTTIDFASAPGEEPACTHTDAHAKIHEVAMHNCLSGNTWFFPLGTVVAGLSAGSRTASCTKSLDAKDHCTLNAPLRHAHPKAVTTFQRLGAEKISFDPVTSLPSSLSYVTHPDDNFNRDIPVEIRYSDYRDVDGAKVPFRIEKLLNGGVVLEISVTSATVNSGASLK